MTVYLGSTAANFLAAQTESVTITRRSTAGKNALGEPTFSISTVYSGPCDIQSPAIGQIGEEKAGLIPMDQLVLLIEVPIGGTLPVLQVGDKAVDATQSYTVNDVYAFAFPYPHVKANLKRGSWS